MTISGRVILLTLVAWCALSLAGCKRPQPSPAYLEASGAYDVLIARMGDDAYADPELGRIRALLQSVPAESSDAAKASALQAKINSDEAEAKARLESARIAREAAKGGTADQFIAGGSPPPPSAPAEVPAPAAVAVDAGVNPFARGADFASFKNEHPLCLESKGPIDMIAPEGNFKAEGWTAKDTSPCRLELPEMQGQMLIVKDGKVVQRTPSAELKRELLYPDGGITQLDGGARKG